MIVQANKSDSQLLAKLHLQTITQGFLSKLGIEFLQSLYTFLIRKELVMVYKENSQIKGLISCAISSRSIMKRFIFDHPLIFFLIITTLLKKPKLIKPLWETYRAPVLSKSNNELEYQIPETELLSISVNPNAQKKSIGTQLLQALEIELKKRNVFRFKVIAGEQLEGANSFYLKNGFVLIKQICIHDKNISNVYVKELF